MKLLPLLLLAVSPLCALSSVVLQDNNAILDEPVRAQSDKWKWESCGQDTDPILIQSIDVSPDPPKPGQNMTVTVNAIAQERIEEGAYAAVTVKIGVIKLLDKEFDLCEEARKADTDVQCPVEQGSYQVVQTVELPKEVPRAKFKVDVIGYTKDDEDLTCLNLEIDFRPQFPHIW